MKIGIIDADLVGRKKHRFPNLACMKISSYYKTLGHDVELKTNYKNLNLYDKVFISKGFTETPVNDEILRLSNVEYGGTGFFFDKAPNLPDDIEHSKPDYTLYDEWVNTKIASGCNKTQFNDYIYGRIGFTTRGCFRKCPCCVNKKYNGAFKHSPVTEFLDNNKRLISLWDDNFLACPDWRSILKELKDTNKSFQFRQGLDLRLMTEEKAVAFKDAKYYGDFIFAFDFIKDRELIESKLALWRKYITKATKLYVLCGFDSEEKYNDDFWIKDIIDTFERIKILMHYKCVPYITRFKSVDGSPYKNSPLKGMYVTLARWCNQPSIFKKKSFREYCIMNGENSSSMRYLKEFEILYPKVANMYFDMKFEKFTQII